MSKKQDEQKRIQTLLSYEILDTDPELSFDDLTQIATQICKTPVALVSLIDSTRQWFKAKVGIEATETPREIAFCAHAIYEDGIFIVEDATLDPRFSCNPLVTGPTQIRFYAGAQLNAPNGQAMGTICVIDQVPRQLSVEQQNALRSLARQVVSLMEHRKNTARLKNIKKRYEISEQQAHFGVWEYDLRDQTIYWSPEVYRIYGLEIAEHAPRYESILNLFEEESRKILSEAVERACTAGEEYRLNLDLLTPGGERRRALCIGLPIFGKNGDVVKLHGTIVNTTEQFLIENELKESRAKVDKREQFLSKVLSSITSLVAYIDKDYVYRYVNPCYKKWFKISAEDCVGKNIENLIGTEAFKVVKLRFDKTLSGEEQLFEAKMPYKTGDHRTIHVKYIPDISPSGEVLGVYSVVDDVSKLKAQDHEISKKSAELDKFFTVSLDLLCIAGTDGMFKKLNPTFSKVLGYTNEELLARPFAEFIHPSDVAPTAKEIQRLASGVPTINFENRFRCRNGSYRILSWSASPDPTTGMLYAAARDITEMRQREAELRQTMDAINKTAIVTITNKDGKIISANDNFCRVSGFTLQEVLGKDHRILSSGTHSKEFFKDLWTVISSGHVWSGEIQNKTKDGKAYFVQTGIAPLINSNGEIEQYMAVRFDVTKEKESERLLLEAQRVAKIGNWSLDLQTNQNRWSKQMYKIFQTEPHTELLHGIESPLHLIHPEDRAHWKSITSKCIQDGKPFQMRFRTIFDNQIIWVQSNGEALKDSFGKTQKISGTCQDITELVHAEERANIERAKAIQNSKLASLGEMSAGIAHEINNPLAIVVGSVHQLTKAISNPEKFAAKIEIINKSCNRIAKIVSGLKKFSRSDNERILENHSLVEIVKEALTLTESKAKRFNTIVNFEQTSNASILCDEIEIEQVVVNMVNNAIDAVKEKTERWVNISVFEDHQSLILRITDSGTGIPEAIQSKLFDPFFTTKAVGEGTGLGLSISKGILDDHKATISIVPHLANTCFEIRFERASSSQAA